MDGGFETGLQKTEPDQLHRRAHHGIHGLQSGLKLFGLNLGCLKYDNLLYIEVQSKLNESDTRI